MTQSLTYYITLFAIKLKGIKKEFSKDPVDYLKIRKADIHHPKGAFYKKNITREFKVLKSSITEVSQSRNSGKLILFIHGGAFISGPVKHHWDSIKEIVKQTDQTVWMCDYPKAPEHTISEISKNIDAIYKTALSEYQADQIICLGDSVGATLITALIQRAIKNNLALPHKIVLVSPVMDATLTNPKIDNIDLIDPMLSKAGVLSAKKMCAENDDLKNEMISPLYGSFIKFPKTVLFLAEHDITYPDQQLTIKKMNESSVSSEIIIGKNMPHIWPFLPVMKEAKIALQEIINKLNN